MVEAAHCQVCKGAHVVIKSNDVWSDVFWCEACPKGREGKTREAAKEWCRLHGFEFRSWDGTFCTYRDPRKAGTLLEYGMESWIS